MKEEYTPKEVMELLKPRWVVYKKVKLNMPHCPICGEMLKGDNSYMRPYQCSCGTWETDWMNLLYFKIKVKTQ